MPTKRTPIARPTRQQFTPEILGAFAEMERLDAQECPPGCDPITLCDNCEEWWQHHKVLHKALGLPPWRWPVYQEGSKLHAELTRASDA